MKKTTIIWSIIALCSGTSALLSTANAGLFHHGGSDSAPQINSQTGNYCSILEPNHDDDGDKFCNDSYGILQDGYILDGACYSTEEDAIAYARTNPDACGFSGAIHIGNCTILTPNHDDDNDKFCNDSYAVDQGGYILDGNCYNHIQDAINAAKASIACQPVQ